MDRNRWASSMFRALLAAGLTVAGTRAARRRAEDPKPSDKKEASGFVDGRKGDVPEGAAELVTPQTEHAVKVGLAWLTKNQNADGSFGSGTYRGNIAVTSLAGLAFMASGSSPGRGPYGSQIDKALALRDGEYVSLGLHCGCRGRRRTARCIRTASARSSSPRRMG